MTDTQVEHDVATVITGTTKEMSEGRLCVTSPDGKSSIILMETQVAHFWRCIEIALKHFFYIDSSVPGAGKTFVSLAVAIYLGLPILTISPRLGRPMWAFTARKHGVRVIEAITYDRLRASRDRKVKHGWLLRTDEVIETKQPTPTKNARESDSDMDSTPKKRKKKVKIRTRFAPSEQLKELLRGGVLVIFDEFHKLRNDTAQTAACNEISRAVIRENRAMIADGIQTRCYFGALSGLPAVSPEEYIRHMRFIGLIQQTALYHSSHGKFTLKGAADLLKESMQLDAEGSRDCYQRFKERMSAPIDEKSTSENAVVLFCYDLYKTVIMKYLVSSMSLPKDMALLNAYNLVLSLDAIPEDAERFRNALRGIVDLTWKGKGKAPEIEAEDMTEEWLRKNTDISRLKKASGTHVLIDLEYSTIGSVIKHALEKRECDPRTKIIFMFSFRRSIERAHQLLVEAGYAPGEDVAVYDGQTSDDSRVEIERRFAIPIDVDEDADFSDEVVEKKKKGVKPLTFIIANLRAASTTISLQDKTGEEPRITYIGLATSIIDIQQAIGRTWRLGSLGIVTVYIVIGSVSGQDEDDNGASGVQANILRSMRVKSDVLTETLPAQVNDNIVFAGNFPYLRA